MKIGMVSPYDWSYPGGVRDHIRHLSAELIKLGHEVRILTPASTAQRLQDVFNENLYIMGHTRPIPINGSIARIAWDSSLTPLLQAILARERFDILHIHEPLVPGLPLTALRLYQGVTVGTFHAFARSSMTSTSYLAYASASPFLRPYFKQLAGHIAVSTVAREFVAHYFPANYRVIPNGVNLERFHQRVVPLPHLSDDKLNILFVGRFERRKGVKYLLQAIPLVRDRHPNTRFIFVGEGHRRQDMQRIVTQRGWSDVIFTGYVPDRELPHYYASADLFCAPATGGESMGIVLLEAMASGVPVVATDIPGYATVVESGINGLLTPPRDSLELAVAMNYLLDHPALRHQYAQAGLLNVRDYAWPHVARNVLDYYYTLLAQRSGLVEPMKESVAIP